MSAPFDPGLRGVARVLPRGVVSARTLPLVRLPISWMSRRTPPDVEVHTVGDITVRIVHPPDGTSGPHPAILWIHGGGFVIGTAAQDDGTCRRLARTHGAVVASVDYRLAPEHPFPVPLDDCHDALVWLAGRDDVDERRIAVAGASAGGGLAAGLALLARDRGQVDLAAQILVYPMLDDRTALRTDVDERHFRLWNNRSNDFGWRCYTGYPPGSPAMWELAAPARHPDLSGLPPAWVGVGTLDLFHDEDVAYAGRLRDAGVDCELHIAPGAFHGFDGIAPKAQVTRDFLAGQDAVLAAALA